VVSGSDCVRVVFRQLHGICHERGPHRVALGGLVRAVAEGAVSRAQTRFFAVCAAADFQVEAPPMPGSHDFTIIRGLLAWNPTERTSAEVARRSFSSQCPPASALCPPDEPAVRSTEDVPRDGAESVAETTFQTPPPRRFGSKAFEEGWLMSMAKKRCEC
jgi:hypothetical protein